MEPNSSLIHIRISMQLRFGEILYVPSILGQLLDLESLAETNFFESIFQSYDQWDMQKHQW